MMHRALAVATLASALAVLLAPSAAPASDGVPDVENAFPAVGFYFVASQPVGGPLEALASCSGTLISERIFLTAAQCTFYDSRRLAEPRQYESAMAWVSFDPVALENDFRCFLVDSGHPGATALACDTRARTQPAPRFRKAVSTGISHPDYPTLQVLDNGTLSIRELFAPGDTDVAVLLLEEPVAGITPLPTLAPGRLTAPGALGTPVVGVGYGLDYHKSIPATPSQPGGEGPTTFEGDFGVRRIASVGTIRTLTSDWIVPTQSNARGEDSVCYGDSGSPLFRVEHGEVVREVIGVLTGGALWCMGAHDRYQRMDNASARAFLDCVKAAATDGEACRCGAEASLALCENR